MKKKGDKHIHLYEMIHIRNLLLINDDLESSLNHHLHFSLINLSHLNYEIKISTQHLALFLSPRVALVITQRHPGQNFFSPSVARVITSEWTLTARASRFAIIFGFERLASNPTTYHLKPSGCVIGSSVEESWGGNSSFVLVFLFFVVLVLRIRFIVFEYSYHNDILQTNTNPHPSNV
jgi:hypothetical protein